VKFEIAFDFSKTERDLRLRFGKFEIWRLDFEKEFERQSKKKDSSKEETDEEGNEDIFQALFDPKVESRIWFLIKRLISRMWNFFSVQYEHIEIKGTLGDPFYDSIAMGMFGGCYQPDWENENGDWSAKGKMILKINFFWFLFFVMSFIYEFAVLIFILWRGTRLARKNPNGENLEGIRKWIFLNYRS